MAPTLELLRELHRDLSVRSVLHAGIGLASFASVAVVALVLVLLGAVAWSVALVGVLVVPVLVHAALLRVLDGGGP